MSLPAVRADTFASGMHVFPVERVVLISITLRRGDR